MSNEKLEAYKALYSKYLEHAVDLHNYHYKFLEHLGLETGKSFRSSIKFMIRLERQLQEASWEAYKERLENTKAERAALRAKRKADQEYRKLHPKKPGRKPKNVNS